MQLHIDIPVDRELVLTVINHLLSFISEDDIATLKHLYIKERVVIVKMFPFIKIPWDAWYARNMDDKEPSIVICYERLLKNKKAIWKVAILIPVAIIFSILLPLLMYMFFLRNNNCKIWLLAQEFKIPYILKHRSYSIIEQKLVATLLFYIGVHIYYPIYGKDGDYMNLNIYEKATIYRKDIIKRYEPIYSKKRYK